MSRRTPGILGYRQRRGAVRALKARGAEDSLVSEPSSSGVGFLPEIARTPSDVGRSGHSARKIRTRAFIVQPNAAGITANPAAMFSSYVRRRLTAARFGGVRPAKLLDPVTLAVVGYMDADTRRVWRDAACTIPLAPSRKVGA